MQVAMDTSDHNQQQLGGVFATLPQLDNIFATFERLAYTLATLWLWLTPQLSELYVRACYFKLTFLGCLF
jgi:hypothetical protein